MKIENWLQVDSLEASGSHFPFSIFHFPFHWGSRPDERAAAFPCDALLTDGDDAFFRAVNVDAPAPLVFRWLCQLRVAPYSYDWLDNRGRRSPRQLTRGLDDLVAGQRVMSIFRLASFARDEHLTLIMRGRATRLFGQVAVTYRVAAVAPGRSRVVAKLAIRYPSWGRWPALRRLFAWGDLVMMRKQLLTLKGLAEGMVYRERARSARAKPAERAGRQALWTHGTPQQGEVWVG